MDGGGSHVQGIGIMNTDFNHNIIKTLTGNLPVAKSRHLSSTGTDMLHVEDICQTPRIKTFKNKKVLRKLTGFVYQINLDEEFSCVVFIKNGNEYHYDVRTSLLTDNKIITNGQPFEFIEEIVQPSDGHGSILVHRYIPAVASSTCHPATLPFDQQTQSKLDSLLQD